ncbi:MAG: helix-turn-helix transcriptional regulator [Clostridia bacterium]|nr:helix-turn-helix transcriptional regulator [Clostridia bacterium]
MKIGERIRARREELGLTLEAVAGGLGVHRSTVKRYESGETQRIPLSTFEKLAVILKTSTEYLMGWETPDDGSQDPEFLVIARMMSKMPQDKKDLLIKIAKTMSDIADEQLKV